MNELGLPEALNEEGPKIEFESQHPINAYVEAMITDKLGQLNFVHIKTDRVIDPKLLVQNTKAQNSQMKRYIESLTRWADDPYSYPNNDGLPNELLIYHLLKVLWPYTAIHASPPWLDFTPNGAKYRSADIFMGVQLKTFFKPTRAIGVSIDKEKQQYTHSLLGIPLTSLRTIDIFGSNLTNVILEFGASNDPQSYLARIAEKYGDQVNAIINPDR